MLVIYRDDGFWTLAWLVISFHLRPLSKRNSLPPGFVVQVSGSFPDIAQKANRPSSIHLCPHPSTAGAHLWRLTFGWGLPQPQ